MGAVLEQRGLPDVATPQTHVYVVVFVWVVLVFVDVIAIVSV